MGFTLGEIKLFLNGLRETVPVGPRWRKLAYRKIQEVEENIRRSRRLNSERNTGQAEIVLERRLHAESRF